MGISYPLRTAINAKKLLRKIPNIAGKEIIPSGLVAGG
jgi:hypothetical protein